MSHPALALISVLVAVIFALQMLALRALLNIPKAEPADLESRARFHEGLRKVRASSAALSKTLREYEARNPGTLKPQRAAAPTGDPAP